ncbi:MAG TPA: glycoside hydrolase family 3 N-terminal domain-containing protein, partial [Chitinophagales bacterium]
MMKRLLIFCAIFIVVFSSTRLLAFFTASKNETFEFSKDKGKKRAKKNKKNKAEIPSEEFVIQHDTVLVTEEETISFLRTDKACKKWVDSVYNSLSPEERIAQCFMLAANTQGKDENMTYILRMARENKCGGVIFFKGNPTAQAAFTNRLNDSIKVPLFVAIDGEWGLAMRLDSTMQYPHQLTLGAIRDNTIIRKMGEAIGKECRRIGLNINFAPVVDVNNNAKNPVINDRSFGENKMNVAVKGVEYMDGLQSQNVVACAKHFPGHGDTDVDSHQTLPTINKSLEQLDTLELFPFKVMFNAGVASVMTAHLNLPKIDSTQNLPSSLSPIVTTDLLRKKLGFQGLIVTDALNMKGASKFY